MTDLTPDPPTYPADLVEENRRLREALKFYANMGNYQSSPSAPIKSMGTHRYSPVDSDNGKKARRALEQSDE